MDSKFYVSLKVAKLLKEKGYRQKYHAYYFGNSNLRKGGYRGDSWYDSPDFYPAPTKAEVIDWLESNGVVVIVDISFSDETWIYSIYREGEHLYDSIISKESCFSTRLEAEEAAIIYALEEL